MREPLRRFRGYRNGFDVRVRYRACRTTMFVHLRFRGFGQFYPLCALARVSCTNHSFSSGLIRIHCKVSHCSLMPMVTIRALFTAHCSPRSLSWLPLQVSSESASVDRSKKQPARNLEGELVSKKGPNQGYGGIHTRSHKSLAFPFAKLNWFRQSGTFPDSPTSKRSIGRDQKSLCGQTESKESVACPDSWCVCVCLC